MSATAEPVEMASGFSVRKTVFWVHLAAGVTIGLVILAMAVTGAGMAYQRQLIALAENGRATVPIPASPAKALPLGRLAQKAVETVPGTPPTSFTLRRDPAAAVAVGFGRDRVIFFDPYTGALRGEGSWVRALLRQVEQFHRNLLLGPSGKAVTGACTLAFLAMLLSGLYLWWPRRWSGRAFAAIAVPSFQARGRARDWNWHNVAGFWLSPLFLVVIATGLVMAYPWANDLLFRAAGDQPPPRKEGGGSGPRTGPRHTPDWQNLDSLLAQAQARVPAWKTITLRLPEIAGGPFNFFIDEGDGGRPDQRAQLALDPKTGETKRWEPFASYGTGRQLRLWTKPIHTGEALGVFGQTLAAVSAAGAGLLTWTGVSLAWRRFRRTGQPISPPRQPLTV